MGLAENIRAKVHHGVLPPGMPVKIQVLFGDGRACSACDEPLLNAQAGFGTFLSRTFFLPGGLLT
jgi:hypothetical protein